MHKTIIAAATLCVYGALSGCCSTGPLRQLPEKNLEIAQLVDAVQLAVEPVWNDSVGGVPISNVTIVLQSVHDNKVSGEADYLLAAVKGYYDKAITHQLTLKLTKLPPPGARVAQASLETAEITKQLQELIRGAQAQVRASYVNGTHALYTNEVDVQIQFQVTVDVSGGVAKWAILPVSLSASDEFSAKTTNTITVAFAPKKAGG